MTRFKGIIILIIVAGVFVLIALLGYMYKGGESLAEDARIINISGLVRGSMQRIAMLESNGRRADENIEDVEIYLKEIEEHNARDRISNVTGEKLLILDKNWEKMKILVEEHRKYPTKESRKELLDHSADCWQVSNDIVFHVQHASEEQSRVLRRVLAFMFVFIVVSIAALQLINSNMQVVIKRVLEKLEADNEQLMITEKKTSDKMNGIIDTMGDGLMIEDENGLVIFANKTLVNMMKYETDSEILEKNWGNYFSLEQEVAVLSSRGSYESLLLTKSGEKIPVLISSTSFFFEDEYVGVLSVIKDITERKNIEQELSKYRENLEELVKERTSELTKTTVQLKQEIVERKQAEEKIQHLAMHDSLTGLPNRFLFFDRLNHAIGRAKRNDTKVALLYLDLDGFKSVNDDHSHEAGDSVLKEASSRMLNCVRETDTVARLGGDEFTVILTDITNQDIVSQVAERICNELCKQFFFAGRAIQIGTSIGVTIYPEHCETPEGLLRNADSAMYRVKKNEKNNFAYYSK